MNRNIFKVSVCLLFGGLLGCSNEIPQVEATFGTAGPPGPGDTDTDADTGADTGTGGGGGFEDYCLPGDGLENPDVENPVRYQCQGQGGGVLAWQQCGSADPVSLACDINDDSEVEVEFPPDPNDPDANPDLNAQACCEPGLLDAQDGEEFAETACIEDCARAACNEAIREIQGRLDGLEPDAVCGDACVGRTRSALETWRDFLVANYDDCLGAARNPGFPMILPNADITDGIGAVYNGTLDLDCAVTADPVETQDSCTDNFNPEEEPPEGSGWACDVSGFATLEQGEGKRRTTTTTAVGGTMEFRVGDCAGQQADCWYQVDAMDLSADPVTSEEGTLRWGVSELAYPLFGRYSRSDNKGTAPYLQLGLDASVYLLSGGKSERFGVRMKNSKAAGVKVRKGFFDFGKVVFDWSSGERVSLKIATDSCSKI